MSNEGFEVRCEPERGSRDGWLVVIRQDGWGHVLSPTIRDKAKAERIASFLDRELGPEYEAFRGWIAKEAGSR